MNVAKYNRMSCKNLFRHYERTKDENGDYIKFGNLNIDPERTHLNYNLAPDHGMSQYDYMQKRCTEVKCLNRKDVNTMCNWVVTAPKDLPEGDQEAFFGAAYDFMIERYGEQNVISAYVHMDESTPHMHFSFVPVVQVLDKKEQEIKKVSAKILINRVELREIHPEIQQYMDERGISCTMISEETKKVNRAIKELQGQTLVKKCEKLHKEIENLSSKTADAQSVLDELNEEIERIQTNLSIVSEIKKVDFSKSLGGKVKISEKDFNNLKDTAAVAERMQGLVKELQHKLDKRSEQAKLFYEAFQNESNKKDEILEEYRNLSNDRNLIIDTIARMPPEFKFEFKKLYQKEHSTPADSSDDSFDDR